MQYILVMPSLSPEATSSLHRHYPDLPARCSSLHSSFLSEWPCLHTLHLDSPTGCSTHCLCPLSHHFVIKQTLSRLTCKMQWPPLFLFVRMAMSSHSSPRLTCRMQHKLAMPSLSHHLVLTQTLSRLTSRMQYILAMPSLSSEATSSLHRHYPDLPARCSSLHSSFSSGWSELHGRNLAQWYHRTPETETGTACRDSNQEHHNVTS